MSRVGSEYVLVVSRSSVAAHFSVSIVPDVRSAIRGWGPASRSSPIFALNGATPPSLSGRSEALLCFIGPMKPEDVPEGLVTFLTFGLYNVVLYARTVAERTQLRKFLDGKGNKPWELWTLKGSIVTQMEVSPHLQHTFKPVSVKPVNLPARLRSATDEYQTLMAVTKARTVDYMPELISELTNFEEEFEHQLQTTDVHSIRKLQWLINVNAALSRFSSQTFAGTSPIAATECHFWTHSFLGIGIASKALLNLRRQIEKASIKAAFVQRIHALKAQPATPEKLNSLRAVDEWWQSAELPRLQGAETKSQGIGIPLVVYYSGRDGFKSTTFTLSAPLESLYGANTYAWSLQTITHELSHVLVEQIVSQILDGDIYSAEWLKKTQEIHSGTRIPTTLFERVQELLVESFTRLEIESQDTQEGQAIDVATNDLPLVVARHYQDVSELLAHLFDYIYFYEQNRRSYLRSIWSSWDVIPNIHSRISNYVTRSLFSLQFSNLTIKDGIDVSIQQLKAELTSLKDSVREQ